MYRAAPVDFPSPMNRKRSFWLLALIPIIGLIWAMKSAASWRPQLIGTQANAECPWMSFDGHLMVVETINNVNGSQIWDVETGQPLWRSRGSSDYSLAMSPDNHILVLAHAAHPLDVPLQLLVGVQLELHDQRTGHLIRRLEKCDFTPEDQLLTCSFSAKSDEVILATKFFVRRWSVATGKLLVAHKWTPVKNQQLGLVTTDYDPDKEQVVAYEIGGPISIFDAHTGRQLRHLAPCLASTDPVGLDNFLWISPDGYSFYEQSEGQPTSRVFRLSDGKLLWRATNWPTFTDDGKLAYLPTNSGLDVFDAHTGRRLNHIPGPKEYGFAISPDGNWIYETRADKIYRWRAR
ncbi:hypothetical protein IAD21_01353 [Abditibacteriota bacterium]|nr:hypothetical protein IAD21_01353 [Abditibacteriota bacterium]